MLIDMERTVRKFLVVDDEDPVIRVVVASVLANFDPHREVPIWLILVGQPASAKTDLISLVSSWRPVWQLPDDLSGSTFQSSKTHDRSLLTRIAASDARILFSQDMGALMDLHRNVSGQIYQQLRGIHDGMLLKETGYDSAPLRYGVETRIDGRAETITTAIPPADRLGFLGAATPEFQHWQTSHNRLGSRFTCYTWLPHGKDDYRRLTEIELRRAEKKHWRNAATGAMLKFLDHVREHIDELADVQITDAQSDRIAAAVKIVNRVTGTSRVTDTGARLHPRVVAMVRMIAFMSGRQFVSEFDMNVAMDLTFSQMRHSDQQQILRFALAPERFVTPWTMPMLTKHTGNIRRVFERTLEEMSEVGILDKSAASRFGKGYSYVASDSLRHLAKVVYPELEAIEGLKVPEPRGTRGRASKGVPAETE